MPRLTHRWTGIGMRIPLFMMFLWILLPSSFHAQVEKSPPNPEAGIPAFYLEALSFESHDTTASRIDIYLEIPYEVLKFVTGDAGFSASYEVTVDVLNGEGGEIFEKSWNEEVRVKTFDETQNRKEHALTQRSISLVSGSYSLRVQVREVESGKTYFRIKKIMVPDYAHTNFSMSDMMLVNKATSETGHTSISPNVTGNLYDLPHGFYVFFEVYNKTRAESVQVTYSVLTRNAACLYSQTERRKLDGPTTEIVSHIDSAQFSLGAYDLEAQVQSIPRPPDTAVFGAQRDHGFFTRWMNVPITMADLDLAIRQAKYIATTDEYDAMTSAKTFEEKQKRFIEFWQKRNASKDFQHNDFMEQYYGRVQYANEHFAHYIEGWRTDMGMVFILLGPPNSVDRHPFDEDAKPYEVWSYYDYNARVIFVDNTGFGDYRLVTPIWDLVRRIH
ncbi:MAG TPA: GWxTD domain-containing protein [Bacteroidota bacterium]|nr:GWxTD domain-containing protein [Bacteroidota bacterium]